MQDPLWDRTLCLLRARGSNGDDNNTFQDETGSYVIDSSSIYDNRRPTQGTFSPYGNNWCGVIDSADNSYYAALGYEATPHPTAMAATADHRVYEYWIKLLSYENLSLSVGNVERVMVMGHNSTTGTANYWGFGPNRLGYLTFQFWNGSTVAQMVSSSQMELGKWYHCAVTISRLNSIYIINLFQDGTSVATYTGAAPISSSSYSIVFGQYNAVKARGYKLSNLRISTGTTRGYTSSSFNVPTSRFTYDSSTYFLGFHNATGKPEGNFASNWEENSQDMVRIEPDGPFPYSSNAAPPYGSLQIADKDSLPNLSPLRWNTKTGEPMRFQNNSSWTIAAWIYPDDNSNTLSSWASTSDGSTLIGEMRINSNLCVWSFGPYGNLGQLCFFYYDGSADHRLLSSGYHIKNRRWSYIVFTRVGANAYMYVNGVQVYNSLLSSQSQPSFSENYSLGCFNSEESKGYVADVHIWDSAYFGTNSTHVVPTSPIATNTDSQFNLNFDNAAIYDQCGRTNWRTNSQDGGTAIKSEVATGKFQKSFYVPKASGFRNDIDDKPHISCTNAYALGWGAGPVTIECWVKINEFINGMPIWAFVGKTLSSISGSQDLSLRMDYNNNNYVFALHPASLDVVYHTTAITLNTFYHVAVTRNTSNVWTIWVDGVSAGARTDSSYWSRPKSCFLGPVGDTTDSRNSNFYIEDFRITSAARYTAAFSRPQNLFPST